MPSDPPTQLDKFKAAAREAGCDDDEARFDERMRRLVAHRPKKDAEPEEPLCD